MLSSDSSFRIAWDGQVMNKTLADRVNSTKFRKAKTKAMKINLDKWLAYSPARQSLSLAAKGLWLHLVWLMHKSPAYGYLELDNEKPMTLSQLSRIVGAPIGQVNSLVIELINASAIAKDSRGAICCPEMIIADTKKAIRRQKKASSKL